MGKKWYKSKTVITNAIAIIAIAIQAEYGFIINPAAQVQILALIELALRFSTNEAIGDN